MGIHLNFVMFRPTPEEMADATAHERAMLDSMNHYQNVLSGYAKLQSTHQTIGYALADSPVGQAAWIYAMLQDVSDRDADAESAFTYDEMLDDIMLYWLPNAGASSAACIGKPSPTWPRRPPIQCTPRWASACFPRS